MMDRPDDDFYMGNYSLSASPIEAKDSLRRTWANNDHFLDACSSSNVMLPSSGEDVAKQHDDCDGPCLNGDFHYPLDDIDERRRESRKNRNKSDKQFITRMALLSTTCSVALLFMLAVSFSEWREVQRQSNDEISGEGLRQPLAKVQIIDEIKQSPRINRIWRRRFLEQQHESNGSRNGYYVESITDGNYSAYRCDEIFTNTPSPSSSSTSSVGYDKRCQYASTCNGGSGLLLPFVFCITPHQQQDDANLTTAYTSTFGQLTNWIALSTPTWLVLLSPVLFLQLTLLFRLLGSSADEYFTPSLSMFCNQLGLPPRFAGVTLLALGNGACDISATMNAIASDNKYGYQMSLGGLTGGGMFVTTVVAGCVILTNGGVVCRGALVRDVLALSVTVTVVAVTLAKGVVGPGTERLFISMYIVFVMIVLFADIYHRAVMLPRIRHEAAVTEHERQLEAEKIAARLAGDTLNKQFEDGDASVGGNSVQTHTSRASSALTAILTALSNYDDVGGVELDVVDKRSSSAVMSVRKVDRHHRQNNRPANDGWGIDSSVESINRPIVLSGSDGTVAHNKYRLSNQYRLGNQHHSQLEWDGVANEEADGVHQHNSKSPYHFMIDDVNTGAESSVDPYRRLLCIKEGRLGHPAHSWSGAFRDGWQELKEHFRESWRDIMDDDDSNRLERLLMILEYPMTLARKLTVSIPCEGSYCRALVALSFALSPVWLSVYLLNSFDVNVWGWYMGVYVSLTSLIGLIIMRFAPEGDGTMSPFIAVPIALYGFVIAATWIDFIADHLVALLEFLGIVARIPNYIMGLTVLAWGNSMPDLSGNVTLARKGLSNMAITACFAGPVFNILVGLGCGFGVLRRATKSDVHYVHLTPAITTGFVFCFINCGLLLLTGLVITKGMIPTRYGYTALVLYTTYIGMSLLLQVLL